MVLASRLPSCQPTTHTAATITSGAGSITETYPSDESDGSKNNSGSKSGPVSLLEKYTFRETVRTVIEEDDLPELPDFLESIDLGDRLDVSSRHIWLTMNIQAFTLGRI